MGGMYTYHKGGIPLLFGGPWKSHENDSYFLAVELYLNPPYFREKNRIFKEKVWYYMHGYILSSEGFFFGGEHQPQPRSEIFLRRWGFRAQIRWFDGL